MLPVLSTTESHPFSFPVAILFGNHTALPAPPAAKDSSPSERNRNAAAPPPAVGPTWRRRTDGLASGLGRVRSLLEQPVRVSEVYISDFWAYIYKNRVGACSMALAPSKPSMNAHFPIKPRLPSHGSAPSKSSA